MINIYFPVILQSPSQFLVYKAGDPVPSTFSMPVNRRIYFRHPNPEQDLVTLFNTVFYYYFVSALINDRQISLAPYDDPAFTFKLAKTPDGLRLARLMGLYAFDPLDLTYYQTIALNTLNPCLVNLQSVYPGPIGYVHESYDLSGTPDRVAVHVVSDSGRAAQISGPARRLLSLSLRALPGHLFSALEEGSDRATWSATYWQASDPAYSAPYVLIVEDDHAWEYAIRRPVTGNDARSVRENWHGRFSLDLELQLIGDWVIS